MRRKLVTKWQDRERSHRLIARRLQRSVTLSHETCAAAEWTSVESNWKPKTEIMIPLYDLLDLAELMRREWATIANEEPADDQTSANGGEE